MAPMRPNETSLGEARSQARNNGRVPNKFSVSVASPHATSETYQIYFKNLNYNFFHGGKKKMMLFVIFCQENMELLACQL